MRAKLILLSGAACLIPMSLAPAAAQADDQAQADNGAFAYAEEGESRATAGPTPLNNEIAEAGARLYEQDPIFRMAQADTQAAAGQGDLPDGFVAVQPGDTVFALSRRHGVKPADIISANSLPAPYALEIGQVIRIPGADETTSSMTVTAAPQAEEQPVTRAAEAAPQENSGQTMAAAAEAAISETPVAPTPQPSIKTVNAAPSDRMTPRDVSYADEAMGASYHTVAAGNTLYSIAREYGVEVGTLAETNEIAPPYNLSIGQQLLIPVSARDAANAANQQEAHQAVATAGEAVTAPTAPRREVSARTDIPSETGRGVTASSERSRFDWPLQGQIIMPYGMSDDGRRNDGINIAAPVGTPIRAVEDGEVVYRGSELEGYGNLLLVKHSDGWVSAYAHTDAILVKKGDAIRKGQIIAKVGTSGSVDQPQLHFELRHELKPTDPVAALDGTNQFAAN